MVETRPGSVIAQRVNRAKGGRRGRSYLNAELKASTSRPREGDRRGTAKADAVGVIHCSRIRAEESAARTSPAAVGGPEKEGGRSKGKKEAV